MYGMDSNKKVSNRELNILYCNYIIFNPTLEKGKTMQWSQRLRSVIICTDWKVLFCFSVYLFSLSIIFSVFFAVYLFLCLSFSLSIFFSVSFFSIVFFLVFYFLCLFFSLSFSLSFFFSVYLFHCSVFFSVYLFLCVSNQLISLCWFYYLVGQYVCMKVWKYV